MAEARAMATRPGFAALAVFILLALCAIRPATASVGATPPSEESLVSAWEELQKNDPKTTVFEKTGDGQYHFATDRFPYDGDLHVLNITIEALPGSVMGESFYGVVEVELTDLPEDFFRKYSYSYSAWQKNNYLYFSPGDGKWSTTTQWSATLAEEYDAPHGYQSYQAVFWLGALLVLLIVLWIGLRQVRAAMAQQKVALDMMARSQEMAGENLKIQKENAKVLKRILETLEKK